MDTAVVFWRACADARVSHRPVFLCIRLYVSAIACTPACVSVRVLERGGNEADGWGEGEGGGGRGRGGGARRLRVCVPAYMCTCVYQTIPLAVFILLFLDNNYVGRCAWMPDAGSDSRSFRQCGHGMWTACTPLPFPSPPPPLPLPQVLPGYICSCLFLVLVALQSFVLFFFFFSFDALFSLYIV